MTWAAGRRVKGMRSCAFARPTAARGTRTRKTRMVALIVCVLAGRKVLFLCDVGGKSKGRNQDEKAGQQGPAPCRQRHAKRLLIMPERVGHACVVCGVCLWLRVCV